MRVEWLTEFAWADGEGGLHFEIPLMLRRLGQADTPENREALTQMLQEMLKNTPAVIKITE